MAKKTHVSYLVNGSNLGILTRVYLGGEKTLSSPFLIGSDVGDLTRVSIRFLGNLKTLAPINGVEDGKGKTPSITLPLGITLLGSKNANFE